ncbi:hypothetical protein VTL71DRAFT_16505 [Oculimacula yallundae]|uniref:Uncharacterized protein n=1 Tax=Oculimacula yallundae TaxID=86028 RepID=A0ABR4CEM0_9HELO
MPLPSPLSPRSPRQRRSSSRSTRHVTFASTDNDDDADTSPRRSYPPTPTRFPRKSSFSSFSNDDDQPSWANYLAFLLILAVITASLAADYAFAKEDQTPFACHVPFHGGWEKCAVTGVGREKVKKVLVAVRVSPEEIESSSRVSASLSSAMFPRETVETLYVETLY